MNEQLLIIKLACALRALDLDHENAHLAVLGIAEAIQTAAAEIGHRVQDMELVLDHITDSPPAEQHLPAFNCETDAELVSAALDRYAARRIPQARY